MTDFELQFRGALHRYLKRNGHDVNRITDYWIDTYVDYDFGFVVEYRDTRGESRLLVIENMSLINFVQML